MKEFVPKQFKYGFTIIYKYGEKSFYSNNYPEYLKWFNCLKRYCIMQNFHLDFEILKELGKGQSARVYKVCSRQTYESFAAKLINKIIPSDYYTFKVSFPSMPY